MRLRVLGVVLLQSALAQPTSIDSLRQAVAANPDDYVAHFNLGYAYSVEGNDSGAVTEYQKVLALHPGVYEAELNMGASLLRLNRFAEAETAFRATLSLKAESAVAEEGLGRALAREDRLSEAEPHYRKAAALDPSYKNSLLDLETIYEAHHKGTEAMAILREFPADPAAQERLGALLLEAGVPAEAVGHLEFAVTQSPTAANRFELAQAYAKLKQLAKAEPLAAQVVAAAPDDDEARMFYGRVLRDQRKFQEAAVQFQTVTVRKPQSAQAWNELAGVELVAEQFQPAIAAFQRLRELGAEAPGDMFFRATAHDHLHQIKEALDNYNRFLAASKGAFPDQEFQARQRILILERESGKR